MSGRSSCMYSLSRLFSAGTLPVMSPKSTARRSDDGVGPRGWFRMTQMSGSNVTVAGRTTPPVSCTGAAVTTVRARSPPYTTTLISIHDACTTRKRPASAGARSWSRKIAGQSCVGSPSHTSTWIGLSSLSLSVVVVAVIKGGVGVAEGGKQNKKAQKQKKKRKKRKMAISR